MAVPIKTLKGLSADLRSKLHDRAIHNTYQILAACKTPAGRQELAKHIDVDPQIILKLANRADLARVRGIGGVFSDLLEETGVDTVTELATRNPDNLHNQLMAINAQKRLAGRVPSLDMVRSWVAQARDLPKLLEH